MPWFNVTYEYRNNEGETVRGKTTVCLPSPERAAAQIRKTRPNARILKIKLDRSTSEAGEA